MRRKSPWRQLAISQKIWINNLRVSEKLKLGKYKEEMQIEKNSKRKKSYNKNNNNWKL